MGDIITAHIGRDLYRTELKVRNQKIIADEPAADGGADLGPKPTELLAMSLAGCTAITVRMYANRKQWDLESLEVTVTHDIVDKKSVFLRKVHAVGNLSAEERERLLQVANACPVHKVLTNPIEVQTTLV